MVAQQKCIFILLLVCVLGQSCSKKYDCADQQFTLAFVHFPAATIDTFILRKYKAADNYQTLIDSLRVVRGISSNYQVRQDTTSVFVTDGQHGIRPGFDWQLYIPATHKTVFVSNIVSEHRTGKRNTGIFSLDPSINCINHAFSAKVDNQTINFPVTETTNPVIYIQY